MDPRRKRILIAVGAVVVVLAAYLYYRSRSGASASSVGTSAQSPSTPTSDQTGSSGDSGGAAAGNPDASALLAALAGENQQLLSTFLNGQQGLISLAGAPVGSPGGSSQVSNSVPTSGGAVVSSSVPVSPATSQAVTANPSGVGDIGSVLGPSSGKVVNLASLPGFNPGPAPTAANSPTVEQGALDIASIYGGGNVETTSPGTVAGPETGAGLNLQNPPGSATASSPGKTVKGYAPGGAIRT